ncbi:DUF4892 domain-containing protein [Motiliproteus sp. MSK22-1]|uniref:DUF4892 domain-containing protein n=1 Tax=Motiliproteus sp. MSK22-1 TaxID=1897630 RepID=UPI0009762F6C|nr:DUF4892 domain-containing protein [Motiliproteus sp. MSK22-1]OMH38719.1 hypothetical protein BGP75_05880 [Motiliproteus sp. MSK22-1]
MLNVILGGLFMFGASMVSASVDVSGSADSDVLERYPLSYIDQYTQLLVPEYRLALGRMKKVNGVISPEKAEYIDGQLTRITYRIPSGHSSKAVFEYFQRQLESIPHDVLFSCEERNCGSSSEWANSQFGIAKLYGVDREQYYLAAKLNLDEGVTVVLYSVRRGNRRVYLHLDVIRPAAAVAGDEGVMAVDAVIRRLQQGDRVAVLDKDWKASELKVLADALLSLLSERPLSDIWLIGHQEKRGPFERLQNDARVYAENLKEMLVGLGVQEARLRTFGVGPLAPAYNSEVPDNRIEIMVE